MKRKYIFAAVMVAAVLLSVCGCSAKKKGSMSLNDIMTQIVSECSVSNTLEITTKDDLAAQYAISADSINDFAAQVGSSSLNQEEIVMIQATTTDAAAAIQSQLNVHYKEKLESCRDYLPDDYKMIQKCEVKTKDKYVYMFISDNAEKMEEIFKADI